LSIESELDGEKDVGRLRLAVGGRRVVLAVLEVRVVEDHWRVAVTEGRYRDARAPLARLSASHDHGIVDLELELITDWWARGPARAESDHMRRDLLAADALGARQIKVAPDVTDGPWERDRWVAEFAAQLGHRRVAIIGDHLLAGPTRPVTLRTPDDVGYYGSRERLRGYYDAFREAGVDWSGITTISTDVNSKEAGTTAAAFLVDQADPPTAVVAFSDILALGVLDALATRGLRPGHDVSVIGFDDIPEAANAALTTIRQPAADRGRLSGQLLLDPPKDPTGWQVMLPTELVVRDSTRPAVTKE
jgi:hypothetical protein